MPRNKNGDVMSVATRKQSSIAFARKPICVATMIERFG